MTRSPTLRSCAALLIAAPASHQGKTTVTAGLARFHRRQGRRVAVFKVGPDFLDPKLLALAAGGEVLNLDLWMGGEDHCRGLLYRAAGSADVILVEGVMGLFDGSPSTADLAQRFNLPVALVIHAKAMAQTFGPLAAGLVRYRPELSFAGVLANGVASPRHAQLLEGSMPAELPWLGAVGRDLPSLPSRHLGLKQPQEIVDVGRCLEEAADAVATTALAHLPPPVAFAPPPAEAPPTPWLAGKRIAIARDAAFGFLYPANLACLEQLGAELVFFSPLAFEALPKADAVYLPGGYPELHLERLTAHLGLKVQLQRHWDAGRPIYAECGGLLYLLETLVDGKGQRAAMAGLLPGQGVVGHRLAGLGLQTATLPVGEIRGHTFHYSTVETPLTPWSYGRHPDGRRGEAIYCRGALTASYLHLYFPSHPEAAAQLFLPPAARTPKALPLVGLRA